MVTYWLLRTLLATLRYPPIATAQRLARWYLRLFDTLLPRYRRIALRNLEIAGLRARPEIVDGMFAHIARMLVVFARLPEITRDNVRDWIRYEGFEHFEQAKARGRGVLFATGHLGNWELSAHSHGLMAEPMHVVVRPLDNARLDDLVESRRRLSGNHVITKKDAARNILRALHANEAVGILADQNTMMNEGVFVDFFGVLACTNPALLRLAAHSGAAVIPGFALWSENEQRYVLRFYPPVEVTGDATRDTQRLHGVIEQVIRAHPEQWLWIHRRWKTRPPGESSLY
jgi:KDO2-lipid IV(A) lauroyltransferase